MWLSLAATVSSFIRKLCSLGKYVNSWWGLNWGAAPCSYWASSPNIAKTLGLELFQLPICGGTHGVRMANLSTSLQHILPIDGGGILVNFPETTLFGEKKHMGPSALDCLVGPAMKSLEPKLVIWFHMSKLHHILIYIYICIHIYIYTHLYTCLYLLIYAYIINCSNHSLNLRH